MPVPLPFDAWQAMSPAEAASEVHQRLAALPEPLRRAAVAVLRPERDLAGELAAAPSDARLRGVPYFQKDLFDVAGMPTKAGSTFLDRIRPVDGDCVFVRRFRELGAALAGKTHLVEFASGLTGENPHYGDCPNPRFPGRLTGGSSSGSAALVAAGVVPLATGTDTGGSVRVPAAFSGLYGFRRTPADEFIHDAFPLAPTMDTVGWFTANAADMATTWSAFSAGGASSPPSPRGCFLSGRAVLSAIDDEVESACAAAARRFAEAVDDRTQGALLDAWQGAVDSYVTIGMSEAHEVHRGWLAPYREHYDPVIWQRFDDAGRYPPEQLLAARAGLERARAGFRRYFETHDFLALPCAPFPALTKAQCTPEARRAILAFTAPASLGGLPCLTIPVPLPSGSSAGLQIVLPRADAPAVGWILRQLA